jgi:hypothetical protein
MKKHIRFLLISILILGMGANHARADDEALAALGGFVAGVITGVIVDDHRDHRGHTKVIIHEERRGHRDYRDYRRDYRDYRGDRHYKGKPHRSGHWEIKRVRVWMPGRYEVRRDRCGDRIRVWVPGHYEWRKERVWVAYSDRGDSRWGRG